MEPKDTGVSEIDTLEQGLLVSRGPDPEPAYRDLEDDIVYTASFEESEDKFVKYQTARWVLYSLLLILAWGIGLFMLVYLPLRRYIMRRDIRARKLYLTRNAIVYEVRRPVTFPCFGTLKREKHVLLASVSDVIIEQGYLQSLFGVYSVRIENVGVRRPPSDDVQIQGVADPHAFKKAVQTHLSHLRTQVLSREASTTEDVQTPRFAQSSIASMSPAKSPMRSFSPRIDEMAILQKVEEVGSSVKRVQTMIEDQFLRTSDSTD